MVQQKSGVLNTNADGLSRNPSTAPDYGPPLPDWDKGDYNVTPATALMYMARDISVELDNTFIQDIWNDAHAVLFLKTHKKPDNVTSTEKDRVYRRAKQFRWLAHNLYRLQKNGLKMQLVPKPHDRIPLITKIHREMGHYGVQRVLDRMQKKYWWRDMGGTIVQVVRACLPCARTKAGFREVGKELQPLALQGLVFRWGIDFAGPLPTTDRGNKYVLVCIEHCTKWVELVALPDKTSGTVARTF